MSTQNLTTAAVKVMRSHDYCHFEVQLGIAEEQITVKQVDNLRKQAARLADKAVEQYKVAKCNIEKLDREARERHYDRVRINRIREIPELNRTPAEQADLKAYEDFQFSRRYDYEDDWQDQD